jgi:hypothetical protein
MDEPAPSVSAGPEDRLARWVATLPPAPFVNELDALVVALRNIGMGPTNG